MSRRSRRRERRNLKRTKTKKHYTLDDIAANAVLYKAFKLASKGVMFKESVQRYRLNVLLRLVGKGVLTYADIERSINSWAGSMKRRHARRSVFEILKLYKNIRNKKLYN